LVTLPAELWVFLSAWLYFIVSKSAEIRDVLRSTERLTDQQRELRRRLSLEFFLFVPASASLLLIIAEPTALSIPWSKVALTSPSVQKAFYAGIGIVSYGFPFASVRRMIQGMALDAVRQILSHIDREFRSTSGQESVQGKDEADDS
jgi:hypothetical protein